MEMKRIHVQPEEVREITQNPYVYDIATEDIFVVTTNNVAKNYEEQGYETEDVEILDLMNNSELEQSEYDVFDSTSFMMFYRNAEPQNEFQEAYDIFSDKIKCFDDFYNELVEESKEPWTEIIETEDGKRIAVFSWGELTSSSDKAVIYLD